MPDDWLVVRPPDIWPTPRSVEIARQIVAGAPAWDGGFSFRVRDDSTALNTSGGWLAAERVDPSAIGTGTANRFRIRFTVDEYNDKLASYVPTLYASRNSGAFGGEEFAVTGSSSYVQATLSGQYADNDSCSTRLLTTYTPAGGTFEGIGKADEVDGALASFSLAVKNAWVEVEFCLYFVDADVSDADTYDFRVYDSGAATDTYTVTPQITVTKSANVSVTPGVGSISTAGQAPSVVLSDPQKVTVPVGSASFAGQIPGVQVSDPQAVTVPVGSSTISGLAPTVGVSVNITVPVGSASLSGLAPLPALSAHVSAIPAAGTVSTAGLAPTPTITAHVSVAPGAGSLSVSGFAPTPSAAAAVAVVVPASAVTITGYAPVVTAAAGLSATPATGSVSVSGLAPTPSVTAHVATTIPAGALTLSGLAPSVLVPVTLTIPVGAITLLGLAPSPVAATPTVRDSHAFTVYINQTHAFEVER